MKKAYIEFCHSEETPSVKFSAVVQYIPSSGHAPARVENIVLTRSMKNISLFALKSLVQAVEQVVELDRSQNEETSIATVGNPSGLPAVKFGLGQALSHVFTGKEGTMLSRLDDIRKLAESEMNEEEKKAASGLMDNLKKLTGK